MACPKLTLSHDQATELVSYRTELGDVASLESAILQDPGLRTRLARWFAENLYDEAKTLWTRHDHFVIRGVPPSDDGSTGLLVAAAFFPRLKPYRGAHIVKHFRLSPWTTELSHTLAEGHFHTDINTAAEPPIGTVMQCVVPDPDAPRHGQLRVARLDDLLDSVRRAGNTRVWRFLTEDRVIMENGTDPESWSGTITDGSTIRYHPVTLRSAQRRCGLNPHDLEDCLAAIHEAALSVSHPIDLAPGEMLVVSNRRALHQRSACTVRFRSFPRDFETRVVAVLHALEDPS
jgi:hypothetical protein